MKKLYISLCIGLFLSLYSQTVLPSGLVGVTTENYIFSRTYLDATTTSNTSTKQIQSVTYFDGLGRSKQSIAIKASPTGKDVVNFIEYDGFGRQTKDFLPIPQTGTQNGSIYTPLSNASAIYGGEKIYAEKILEASPLNRIQQQIQVGNDWATHPVQFGYDTNTGSEVKKYTTTTTWSNNATTSNINVLGNYPGNQLYKTTVTDEDLNVSIEFKNGEGQAILVRKNDGSQDVDTYYVYNEYNQLAFILSPKASAKYKLLPIGTIINGTDATLNDLCYQYKYDARNRLVEKKLPGKGWEYMVYDKADRIAATKDVQNEWIFMKYDKFNRVVYTGLANLGTSRSSLQNSYDTSVEHNEIRNGSFTKSNMQVEYTNEVYPTSFSKLLSVNYYDTYPTTPFLLSIPSVVLGQSTLTQNVQSSAISTKSLPTASYVKNIEDDAWTKNYTWYDTKGRPVGSYSMNHLGGFTETKSLLGFAGEIQENNTRHKRLDSDTEILVHEEFTYDTQNRMVLHKHKVNNNFIVTLAENNYDELSRLNYKKVGDNLQQIDYVYNIRGWMTGINDPTNLGTDLFGYKIKYNQVEGLPFPNTDYPTYEVQSKYNGNIAEVDWKTASTANDNLRRYGYVYDDLNRLKAGFYQANNNPSGKEYGEILSYDENGNIGTLKRTGKVLNNIAETIDNLGYTYLGNQLQTVTDSSTNYIGYPDTSGSVILYDENGNMTKQEDKGLLQINYNHLNLPNYMQFNEFVVRNIKKSNLQYIYFKNTSYIYRSDGIKLKKVYKYFINSNQSDATDTTEYLDGFQYSTTDYTGVHPFIPIITANELQFVPTSEGYYNFKNNSYIYNYVDHLGNTRLSYFNGSSGAEVLEENNYYPFGLKHEGYNPTVGNPTYNYKYNGKELQETGMYDYGARMYMPDIGRWGVVDPLAEATPNFSPYAYALNNPIRYVDPTGMIAEDCPKCPKPSYEGQTMSGSDGRNYGAARQAGDGYGFAATKSLEWLPQSDIEEVTITGKAKAPTEPVEIAQNNSGNQMGSNYNFPLQSPALSYDIPIFATPYMLLEAVFADGLIKGGMDSDNAQMTASAATFLFTLKPGGLGKNTVTRTESSLGHIFRDKLNHVNPTTVASQNRYINLFENVANKTGVNNPNVLNNFQRTTDGFQGFSQTFRNGKQVWTQTLNGKIINAGVNNTPK